MELRVFDLVNRSWLANESAVIYRNTLLGHLFPDVKFAIGDCLSLLMEDDVDEDAIASLLDAGWDDYRIVGASGSRKHGRVIYALGGGDYFTRFFGSNANAVNYGSNLTTECKSIVDLQVKLLVVEDGEYGTSDCHGKMSAAFAHTLADSISNPIQFRAACLAHNWMAKGTLAYSYKVSRSSSKYDIVLPTSSFKGNKVAPGEYTVDLAIGVVFTSPQAKTRTKTYDIFGMQVEQETTSWDWRKANLSYSVVQFLPWDAVEADILPATKKAAVELNSLILNQRKLAEYLVRDEDDEDDDSEQYVSRLAQVVEADVHCQLSSHPWVVKYTSELFRKRWLRLATAGAIRFNSSMVMPDECLPDNTICIPGLPDGEEVIVFPYPCRWKYDIKVWRNVYLKEWENSQGVIVINTQTALKLGRDFDGDCLMWLPASKLPNIAIAVKGFGEPSIDQAGIKPKKNPLTGTLGEIAVMSMSNDTGLITWLIAKAWALGKEKFVNQLVPQLQAAVDSLKGATPPDQQLLKSIAVAMKHEQVAWLNEYKGGVYLSNPISDDGRGDTISRLIREVNQFWSAPEFRVSKLSVFAPLFPLPKANWLERAKQVCKQYSAAMWEAGKEEAQYEKVPRHIADACDAKRKSVIARFAETLAKCDTPEKRMGAVSAFWHSRHNCNSPDQHSAYICFLVGLPEICQQLQELRITKLHILGKRWSDYPDAVFKGETIALRLVPHTNNYLFAQDKDNKFLGCLSVNDSPLFLQDVWFEAEVYTRFDKRNQPMYNELILLDKF